MPLISIQATDTLFFRDGRPFSMGDESFAQGIFPPPPSVIYGALRAAAIAKGLEEGKDLDQLLANTDNLSIGFFAFQINRSIYFPMPLDLIVTRDSDLRTKALSLEERPAYTNASSPYALKSDTKEKIEDEPKLLGNLSFSHKYLNGQVSNLPAVKRSDYMVSETKIGIGRNRESNVAQDGRLFRVQTNRMAKEVNGVIHHLKFFLEYEGVELPEKGWLTIGGERRIAYYQFENEIVQTISCPNLESPQFKIYISTPAVFETGWEPTALLEIYNLKLLTAALDRPIQIGGWDMQKRKPKPMLHCVPAGSVYYVEAKSIEAAQKAAFAIHGKPISDKLNNTDYGKQGFGIAYIGKI